MKKKLCGLLLAMVMLVGSFGALPAQGATVLTDEEVVEALDQLQEAFPDGGYWNHPVGQVPDGNLVTDRPCDDTTTVCNNEIYGGQCVGFARLLASKVFGRDESDGYRFYRFPTPELGWTYVEQEENIHFVEPGDILGMRTPDGTVNHEAIVWKVEGDRIQVGECWGSSGCRIWWGDFNGTSEFSTLAQMKAAGDVWIHKRPGTKDIPYQGTPFYDIATHWGREACKWAYEQQLFLGVSPSAFGPDQTMSRAMLVTVLYRLAGSPPAAYTPSFSDVPEGQYFSIPASWAAKEGIVGGMGNGLFAPNDSLTREQLATMLYRFASLEEVPDFTGDLSPFPDAQQVSPWAREAMGWAVASGIIQGKSGNLAPASPATRAEVATMLQRVDRLDSVDPAER